MLTPEQKRLIELVAENEQIRSTMRQAEIAAAHGDFDKALELLRTVIPDSAALGNACDEEE